MTDWTVTVNGKAFSIAPGTAPTVEDRLNDLNSFAVAIDNTNVSRDEIGAGNAVVIAFQGTTLISGYCDLPKWGQNAIIISGKEQARELETELISIGGTHFVEYDTTDISTVLVALLALKGYTLDAVNRPGLQDISVKLYLDNILDGVVDVIDIVGMDWYFDGTNLNVVNDKGSAKGEIFNYVVTDKKDKYQRIENQIILYYVDQDGNRQYVTGNNAASQATYGVMQGGAETEVAWDSTTAQLLADAIAADKGELPITITVEQSIPEVMARSLASGDDIAVVDVQRGLVASTNYEIQRISYRGGRVVLEIGSTLPDKTGETLRYLERLAEKRQTEVSVEQIPTGEQGWGTNIQIRPGVGGANQHNSFEWDDGAAGNATIKFSDGTTITITAGNHAGLAANTEYVYYCKANEDPTTLYLAADYDDLDAVEVIPLVRLQTPAAGSTTEYVEVWPLYNASYTGPVIGSGYLSAGVIITPDFRTAWNVGAGGGPAGIRITATEIAGYSGGVTKEFYLEAATGKAFFGGGAIRCDAAGLHIDGGSLFLVYDGVGALIGGISGAVGTMAMANANNAQINIAATDGHLYLSSIGVGNTYLSSQDNVDITAGDDVDIAGDAIVINSLGGAGNGIRIIAGSSYLEIDYGDNDIYLHSDDDMFISADDNIDITAARLYANVTSGTGQGIKLQSGTSYIEIEYGDDDVIINAEDNFDVTADRFYVNALGGAGQGIKLEAGSSYLEIDYGNDDVALVADDDLTLSGDLILIDAAGGAGAGVRIVGLNSYLEIDYGDDDVWLSSDDDMTIRADDTINLAPSGNLLINSLATLSAVRTWVDAAAQTHTVTITKGLIRSWTVV